jgi:hypothetical protein
MCAVAKLTGVGVEIRVKAANPKQRSLFDDLDSDVESFLDEEVPTES